LRNFPVFSLSKGNFRVRAVRSRLRPPAASQHSDRTLEISSGNFLTVVLCTGGSGHPQGIEQQIKAVSAPANEIFKGLADWGQALFLLLDSTSEAIETRIEALQGDVNRIALANQINLIHSRPPGETRTRLQLR